MDEPSIAPPKPSDAYEHVTPPGQRRGRRSRTPRQQHNAYDAFMIKSKTEGKEVELELAVPTSYTDEDGFCNAIVHHVDKFAVEFGISTKGKRVWINKAFIVSVGLAR